MSRTDAYAGDFLVIRHNAGRVDREPDPRLPYRLDVNLRPPQLMVVTFVMLHGGSEEIAVCCRDMAAAERFLDESDLRGHPRLRWARVTGPDGVVKQLHPPQKAE